MIKKKVTYYGDENLPLSVFSRVNFVNPKAELRQPIALPRAFEGGGVATVLSNDSEVFFRFFSRATDGILYLRNCHY